MDNRELTCICCPMGCQITVTMDDSGTVTSVTGNTCPRGDVYARKEVTSPTRVVTTTVRVTGSISGVRTVSCKTASDIPKDKIFDIISSLKDMTLSCPVCIGDVILEDAAGTGVPVIATSNAV
ncbi:MAG: DUF1667 domain-containing protein [Clostridiales bacterium]|nr:DUF1667 domain-containing protein [Clostridiales bacterium]